MHVYVLTGYVLKYADQGPPGIPILKVKNSPLTPKTEHSRCQKITILYI